MLPSIAELTCGLFNSAHLLTLLSVAMAVTHSNKQGVTMLLVWPLVTGGIAICIPTNLERARPIKHARLCEKRSTGTSGAKSIVLHLRRRNCQVSCEPVGLSLINIEQTLVQAMNYRRTVSIRRRHVLRTNLLYL